MSPRNARREGALATLVGALAMGALSASCATSRSGHASASAEEAQLRDEVSRLSSEAEGVLKAQSELVWASWTAAAKPQIASSYQGHEALFTKENIAKIDKLRGKATDPGETRALSALLSHFVGEYLAEKLAPTTEAVANLESAAKFAVDGKDVHYRDLDRVLAAEKNAPKRRAIYAAATAVVRRLSTSIRRREDQKAQLVTDLGFESYEAFGSRLRHVDPRQLALLAEQVLTITEPAYQQVLEQMSMQELELPKDQLRRCDFPRLFRTPSVDPSFPAAEVLQRAERTVEGMGVSLRQLKNLKIDSAETSGKQARALAIAVDVPKDIRLSFRPTPGVRAQSALLGEMGRALHFAFTRPMRFELRSLGDVTAAEAYAFVFEDLVEDPVWLEEHASLSGGALDQYLQTSAAIMLHRIRITAGRLLYELQLRRRGLQDAKEIYGPIMARAYGVPFDAEDSERALADLEDFYQSADDFLAWFLAGQIQGQLKARFGPAWWRQLASAAFLHALWSRGQSLTGREVVGLIGEERLRPDILLLRLSSMLKIPITVPASFGSEVEAGTPDADPPQPPK